MIKEPMVMEIAKNTYAINEFGLSACYFSGRRGACAFD